MAEGWVEFAAEVSVIVARGQDGNAVAYPVGLNHHERHILDTTMMPAPVGPIVALEARTLALAVAQALGTVGVLCVEFFLTAEGRLLVNEIAPRPHNSGHLTLEAATVCQFEQQVRALCGLPLGRSDLIMPAAMVNLLGDLWANGEPRWESALRLDPAVKIHLYGKRHRRGPQDGPPDRARPRSPESPGPGTRRAPGARRVVTASPNQGGQGPLFSVLLMQFAHPGWFFLLVLVPVPLLLERARPRILWPSFAELPPGQRRRSGRLLLRFLPAILRGLALGALAVALARPQTVGGVIRIAGQGLAIVVALDQSSSMSTADFPVDQATRRISRLEAAKATFTSFVEGRPDDLIGLVVFANYPDLSCPPTLDHRFLVESVAAIRPAQAGRRRHEHW